MSARRPDLKAPAEATRPLTLAGVVIERRGTADDLEPYTRIPGRLVAVALTLASHRWQDLDELLDPASIHLQTAKVAEVLDEIYSGELKATPALLDLLREESRSAALRVELLKVTTVTGEYDVIRPREVSA